MPSSFTLAELAAFEQTAKSAAPPQTPTLPEATIQENQPGESSTPIAASDETVETSAESTPAATEEVAPAVASETAVSEAAKPKGAKERIEGLVDENKALKEYAEYWRNQATPAAAQPAVAAQAPAVVSTAPAVEEAPTLESCEFDTAKWTKAMTAYTNKQIKSGVAAALQANNQAQTAQTVQAAFAARSEAFRAKTPDFDVVMANPQLTKLTPLSRDAAELVVASDLGPQIAYYFAKNPDKAVRIARQSPAQQAAAIGRLEAELTVLATKPPQKTPTNNITKAPAPPAPIPAGGTVAFDPSNPKAPMKDFVAHHRAQAAARRQTRR